MDKTNIAHSLIDSFPPDINKFPKFYNTKERLFVLEPGDMIYIPPKWFHWVHSYPDTHDRENIAVSFPAVEYEPPIFNQFSLNKPFIYTLSKDEYPFLSITRDDIGSRDPSEKYKSLVSRNNKLIPVNKGQSVPWHEITISDAVDLADNGNFISIGQSCKIASSLKVTPPHFLLSSFPNCTFTSCLWLYLYPPKLNNGININNRGILECSNSYIDTGLHYDHNPNILIQIKGKKVIRMYVPEESNNLYVSPLQMV